MEPPNHGDHFGGFQFFGISRGSGQLAPAILRVMVMVLGIVAI